MSAFCGVCDVSNDANDTIKCAGSCNKVFHLSCVVKKYPDAVKTRGSKKEWFCEDCKLFKSTPSNSSKSGETPTVLTVEYFKSTLEAFKIEIFAEFRKQSTDYASFKTSLEFFSNTIDEASKTMDEIKKQNQQILREHESFKKKNVELENRVGELETKIRDLEQYSRRDNIEISGLPKTTGEDEMRILQDVGRAIGVEVETNGVVAVHRVPAFNKVRNPAIIARFNTRNQRDAWLQAYRKKRTLLASDVNKNFPATRVYIGEHLTPGNKLLLKNLKEAGNTLNIKYIWCREGKFFARKDEGKKAVRVGSVAELKNIDWR